MIRYDPAMNQFDYFVRIMSAKKIDRIIKIDKMRCFHIFKDSDIITSSGIFGVITFKFMSILSSGTN